MRSEYAIARAGAWVQARGGPLLGVETQDFVEMLLDDPCCYCGTRTPRAVGTRPGRITIDHIIPMLSGGGDTWANLTAACPSCNSRKGARPLLWMVGEMGRLRLDGGESKSTPRRTERTLRRQKPRRAAASMQSEAAAVHDNVVQLMIPITEAARLLRITVPQYRRVAAKNDLPLVRIGRRERVPLAALEAVVNAAWQPPQAPKPQPAPRHTRRAPTALPTPAERILGLR